MTVTTGTCERCGCVYLVPGVGDIDDPIVCGECRSSEIGLLNTDWPRVIMNVLAFFGAMTVLSWVFSAIMWATGAVE